MIVKAKKKENILGLD